MLNANIGGFVFVQNIFYINKLGDGEKIKELTAVCAEGNFHELCEIKMVQCWPIPEPHQRGKCDCNPRIVSIFDHSWCNIIHYTYTVAPVGRLSHRIARILCTLCMGRPRMYGWIYILMKWFRLTWTECLLKHF